MRYFVDTGDGVEYYETEAEAMAAASSWIDTYRTEADGEWPEEVERVCWGVVRQVSLSEPTDATGNYIDYKLRDVK